MPSVSPSLPPAKSFSKGQRKGRDADKSSPQSSALPLDAQDMLILSISFLGRPYKSHLQPFPQDDQVETLFCLTP